MDKIGDILGGAMRKKGLSAATDGALVCFYADKWAKRRFSSISFSKGILKVAVDSSPAAAELQMQEGALIDFINDKLKKPAVKAVRIVVIR